MIYPYHAHLLETIRITGHWQAFEEWKREIVSSVWAEGRAADGMPAPVWDFSGFNELTSGSVPPKGDHHDKMRWYWEAGHFKRDLGDLVLARIIGHTNSVPGFGVLLDPGNVEGLIESIEKQEIAYRRNHENDVKDLERIAAGILPH